MADNTKISTSKTRATSSKTQVFNSGGVSQKTGNDTKQHSDIHSREEEYKRLNAELEAKTALLVQEAEIVMKEQENILARSHLLDNIDAEEFLQELDEGYSNKSQRSEIKPANFDFLKIVYGTPHKFPKFIRSRPEPVNFGPLKNYPAGPEPINLELLKNYPAGPEPINLGLLKNDPAGPEPINLGLLKNDPAGPEPINLGLQKNDPAGPEPINLGLLKNYPAGPEPINPEKL
ncbi:hypothetical protein Btru_016279 [Bulinus truncatus]|nr:hypothetical protein Btru_016279 [Bulinus truncatus]